MVLHPNNIFALAEKQLQAEKGDNYSCVEVLEYATKIRHFMDRNAKFVKTILNGGEMSIQAMRYHNIKQK